METRTHFSNTLALALGIFVVIVTAGCAPGVSPTELARFQRGLLYNRTTKPAVLNIQHARRGERDAKLDSYRVREPVTSVNVSAEWSSYGIGDAMLKGDLKQAQYADIERFSILGGLFERRTIHVYGK